MTRNPDFFIIGAMKCATTTLHDQLALQPGFRMSNPKEPNFFSDDENWANGLDWYRSLFSGADENTLCGESSTHYTKLPDFPHTIERMRDFVDGHTKFIYIIRHPIDRLVSHYVHEWSEVVVSEPIDRAVELYPRFVDYSRYAMQIGPYLDEFGPDRVLLVFFERLVRESQQELERVCDFLDYGSDPHWVVGSSRQNNSDVRLRKTALVKFVRAVPRLKSAVQSVVPQRAQNMLKDRLRMNKPPTLGEKQMVRLVSVFDEDLLRLGKWIGTELNCANFKSIASRTSPVWDMSKLERALAFK